MTIKIISKTSKTSIKGVTFMFGFINFSSKNQKSKAAGQKNRQDFDIQPTAFDLDA
jgi:hypothetical protein